MINRSKGPRCEYCQQQRQRVEDSTPLAASYPQLKALTVNLEYLDPSGIIKAREVKYRVNLDHARAVFLFACPSTECIGGDFDLSAELASAVAKRRKAVTGEMHCQGRCKKAFRGLVSCRSILRYRLNLAYSGRR